jgi:hypothetical protein
MAKFRSARSQSDSTAAVAAYTAWYNATHAVVSDVAPRLDRLGIRCG